MRAVRPLVVAALVLVVLATPTVVLADGRVALVVGNSTYAHIGRLPNPDNDARDISVTLRRPCSSMRRMNSVAAPGRGPLGAVPLVGPRSGNGSP